MASLVIPSEMLAPLAEVGQLLDSMETAGKLDLTIVPKLSTLVSQARTNLEFWRTAKDVGKETAFVEYHAWRNISLMLSTMKDRLEHAAARHENPSVVTEAADLLPSVFVTVNLLYDNPPAQVSERERSQILTRIRNLRGIASRCNMLPSLQQELAGVDMQELRKRMAQLALSIGTELVEA